MAKITATDMHLVDKLFEMEGGWVLNFSNRTFSSFFLDELNIDIDDPRYDKNGTSKAKRLRTFLHEVDNQTAIRVLSALWKYRNQLYQDSAKPDPVSNAEGRYLELIGKLQGNFQSAPLEHGLTPAPATNIVIVSELKAELIALSAMSGLSNELCNPSFHNAPSGTRSSPNITWKLCSAGFQ